MNVLPKAALFLLIQVKKLLLFEKPFYIEGTNNTA